MNVGRAIAALIAVAALAAPAVRAAPDSGPGQLDGGFGSGGLLNLHLPGQPTRMAVGGDGGIAVSVDTKDGVAVAMVTADGRLDSRFAGTGLRSLQLGPSSVTSGLGRTPGGDVLVAAWSDDPATSVGTVTNGRVAITKLRSDGTVDGSFGERGIATTQLGELTPLEHIPSAFAVAPDGSMYVVGTTGGGLGWFGGAYTAILVRFNADGSRDTTFGTGGVVLVSPGPLAWVTAMTVDPHGRILVGDVKPTPFGGPPVLRRFLPDGRPDPTFGVGGAAPLSLAGHVAWLSDVHVDDQGRIVCYGDNSSRLDPWRNPGDAWSPGVVRLRDDGSLDPTFGTGGGVVLSHDNSGRALGSAIRSAATGTGMVASASLDHMSQPMSTIVRLDHDGRLDLTFGGRSETTLPMDEVRAILATGSRAIVLGVNGPGETVLAAYTL